MSNHSYMYGPEKKWNLTDKTCKCLTHLKRIYIVKIEF